MNIHCARTLLAVYILSGGGNGHHADAFITDVINGIRTTGYLLPPFNRNYHPRNNKRRTPLSMSTTAPPPLDSSYTVSSLSPFDNDLHHEFEIVTSSLPLRSLKKNTAMTHASNRRKIKVHLEEVERMRKTVPSSASLLTATPQRSRINGPRRLKKTPIVEKKNPSPALSIPYANETPQPTKRKTNKNNLLTHEEEKRLTFAISELQRAKSVRNELALNRNATYHPSEAEWAQAANLSLFELRRLIHDGKKAREELIAKNAGLVIQIAKRYHKRSARGSILTLQDMIQEGNLGLMVAAERFDPRRGFRFSTYAAWWVRQRIVRCIADQSRVIRLPVHVHTTLREIEKTRQEMADEIGRPPTEPELAHKLSMSLEKFKLYTDASQAVLSLENPLRRNGKPDDKRTISDGIASDNPTPEDNAQTNFLKQDIRSVMDNELSKKERDVLVLRYGLDDGNPKTIDQVASILNVSRERIRLFEARAMNKLRNPGRNYKLKEYVGGGVEEPVPIERSTPEQIWSF